MYSDKEKEDRFEQVMVRLERGEALRTVLRSENAPMSQTVFYEMLDDPNKNVRYAHACKVRALELFEDIIEIADCEDNDEYIDGEGMPRVNHDAIHRDRLRIDARKWVLSKLEPKKYGDKIDLTSDGKKLDSVTVFQLPDNGRG